MASRARSCVAVDAISRSHALALRIVATLEDATFALRTIEWNCPSGHDRQFFFRGDSSLASQAHEPRRSRPLRTATGGAVTPWLGCDTSRSLKHLIKCGWGCADLDRKNDLPLMPEFERAKHHRGLAGKIVAVAISRSDRARASQRRYS